ncbi:uncharacterized protein DUF2817 [Paraburkholderia sp. BL8N3]|jgi:hypothetical protein|nr:M14 family metallopeptidase [Paraburkholderia sp. BL8N3]TCK34821.1 uncharacterized protein DUF2817 [Paraburkholderia sp. BL8N3]
MNPASCFSASYREARERFLRLAAARSVTVDSRVLPRLTGLEGEPLATDVVRLGPAGARRLLVLTSGTHGVEGFCGSAAQLALLDDPALDPLLAKLGVAILFVHAINPYGFSFLSRTTEANVDLNRNSVDFGAPLPRNPAYDEVHGLLVPEAWPPSPANAAAIRQYIETRGEWAYQQAVTTGQYTHPHGMFFGGSEPAWSTTTLRELLADYGEACESIGWIDFHTGLGPPGFGAKISVGSGGSGELRRARSWWGADVTSPLDGTSIAADVAGPVSEVLRQTCAHAANAAIAIEYGTVPLSDMLHMLRADVWLRHHPQAPEALQAEIRADMRSAFCLDDDGWKGMVVGQAQVAVLQALYGLSRETR